MKLIDERLYKNKNLLTHCNVCRLPIRKGKENKNKFEECRFINKRFELSSIKPDEYIAWVCPVCVKEYADKDDDETANDFNKNKNKKKVSKKK